MAFTPKQSLKLYVIIPAGESTIIGPSESGRSLFPSSGSNLAQIRLIFSHPGLKILESQKWCCCGRARWVYLHAGGCRGRPICPLERSLIYVSCCCRLCQHTATLLLNRGDSWGALERRESSIIWVKLWSGTSRTPGLGWDFSCTCKIYTSTCSSSCCFNLFTEMIHLCGNVFC